MLPFVNRRRTLVRHPMIVLQPSVPGVPGVPGIAGTLRQSVMEGVRRNNAMQRVFRTRVQARRLRHHQGEPGSEQCREHATAQRPVHHHPNSSLQSPFRVNTRIERGTAERHISGMTSKDPLVGIVMGSKSDYDYLAPACEMLTHLGIPYEAKVLSAHRTPDQTSEWASIAESRGMQVIIAAAGGAAHLAGVIAAKTLLPVLGVPIPSTSLNGLDSLLSIVQMPAGIPVGTLAIGKPGATNAAIFAAEIIGLQRKDVRDKLQAWRESRARDVLSQTLP